MVELHDQPVESPEQDNLNNELAQCHLALQGAKERYLYLTAEFDNYKKRIERERSLWREEVQADVLKDVLPIVDNFQRALAQIKAQDIPQEIASHLEGIELINKLIEKLLVQYNIQAIEASTVFNPELHEAVMQVETNEHPSGAIVNLYQQGYTHKGKVLRPAQVSVAK
jgi:molecular chaperone GrpE